MLVALLIQPAYGTQASAQDRAQMAIAVPDRRRGLGGVVEAASACGLGCTEIIAKGRNILSRRCVHASGSKADESFGARRLCAMR